MKNNYSDLKTCTMKTFFINAAEMRFESTSLRSYIFHCTLKARVTMYFQKKYYPITQKALFSVPLLFVIAIRISSKYYVSNESNAEFYRPLQTNYLIIINFTARSRTDNESNVN